MAIPPYASWMLEQEARALLTRLARVKPFALQETMLPAAGLLPMAGSAIGGYFGGPAGAQIGGKLAQTAGGMFGLGETENEEREFEAAQTFVRLAADTVKNAAGAPPNAPPAVIAQNALAQAAQVHAPGLVGPAGPTAGPGANGQMGGHNRSGRWIRRGGKIVLFGA